MYSVSFSEGLLSESLLYNVFVYISEGESYNNMYKLPAALDIIGIDS